MTTVDEDDLTEKGEKSTSLIQLSITLKESKGKSKCCCSSKTSRTDMKDEYITKGTSPFFLSHAH